jgi:hypothetical protein
MMKSVRLACWLPAFCLVVLNGCGDDGGSSSDTLPAARGGGAGAGVGGGGATGGESAATGGSEQQAGGYILLLSRTFENRYLLQAAFHEASTGSGSSCVHTTEGDCMYSQCDSSSAAVTSSPHAGTITVSSADAEFSATLEPDADGSYPPLNASFTNGVFAGQETTQFSAAGATVPAFQHTMTYPLLLLLDAPATADGLLQVPRSQALSLSWSRGATNVEFSLMSVSTTGVDQGTLNCNVPSTQGALTVAASLLEQLSPGTELWLLTWAQETVQAGDYAVQLRLGGAVATPDRSAAVEIVLE